MKAWLVCVLLFLHLAAAQGGPKSTADTGQSSTTSRDSSPTSTTDNVKSTPSTTSTLPVSSPTPSNPPSNPQSIDSSTSPTTVQSQTSLSTTSSASTPTSLVTSVSGGVIITFTVTGSGTSSSSSPAPTTNSSSDTSGSTSLGAGPIIGMSVAGGIAVIAVIAFIIWKLTRKRFSEFENDEAIKWPELNAHGNPDTHAIPAHSTGRAGFETGSDASLSRVNSDNYSTPDFVNGAGSDPYAVPPLPHLNPNQPYRDEPAGSSDYYDPYRGPIPGTIEHDGADWSGEAIPMTQMGGPTRTMSPTPSAAFAMDGGRQSPAPRRASPGPQVAYGAGARYDPYGSR